MSPKIERDKPIILVDVDDTLSKTWNSYLHDFGKHALKCFVNATKPANWLKGPKYIVEKSLKETDFYRKLPPQEDSLGVLDELAGEYKFVIATKRRDYLKEDTEYWLSKNYPDIFSDTFYGVKDKGKLATELDAVGLIDNDIMHHRSMEEHGIESIWFAPSWWDKIAHRGTHKQAVSWKAVGDILRDRKN